MCVEAWGASGLTKRKLMLHNDMILLVQLSKKGTPTAKGIKPSRAVWGGSVLRCQGAEQSPALPRPTHKWDHELQPQLQPDPLWLPPWHQRWLGPAGVFPPGSQRPRGCRGHPHLPFLRRPKLPAPWKVLGVWKRQLPPRWKWEGDDAEPQ